MSSKPIYIILFILLLIALGLLGVFWYLSSKNNAVVLPENNLPVAEENKIATETPVVIPEENNSGLSPLSDEEKEKAQLQQLASAFVERYGSYSNQTDFENLTDLMLFMSRGLKIWAENLIATKRLNSPSQAPYYGVTTKVLKTEIITFNNDLVEINVSTQKSEMFGTNYNSKVSYEDLMVSLVKEEGVWKVEKVIK